MSANQKEVIALPSHFSQVQLCGLKELVDHHLEDEHQLQFDAADVERMDGAAVQFLLAIAQTASPNHSLVINSNSVLTNAFSDMGVQDMIMVQEKSDNTESESSN